MPKISALPPMTTADAADEAPIVDTSVSTTKKWTLTLLKTYLQSLTAWVTAAMIVGIDKSLLTSDVNPYKFAVYRNAAFNVGNNVLAKITFDTELYDSNNNFASGTYTAPVAGFYHFDWGVGLGASGFVLASLFKNGSELRRGNEINQAGTTDAELVGGVDLQLSANDTIEIYAQGGSSLAGQIGQVRTYFNGHLISRT